MAWDGQGFDESFQLNVSTTAKQYYIVKHTTTAETVTLTTAAGERAFGIVQQPTSSGGWAPVRYFGVSKVYHDGTLTAGVQFQCSTAGLATAASTETGIYRLGTVIKAASTVSATVATVLFSPNGQSTN